jgi:uncharacterized protein YndB with AHSA1/START domain
MTTAEVVAVSVRIEATPEVVFPYFTDPALLVRWIGDWADLHPVEGGTFALDVSQVPVRGRYLAVEAPHRVVFTWGIAGNDVLPADSSRVEVLLTADGDDTVVELTHHGLPAVQIEPHRAGWTAFLQRLSETTAG